MQIMLKLTNAATEDITTRATETNRSCFIQLLRLLEADVVDIRSYSTVC